MPTEYEVKVKLTMTDEGTLRVADDFEQRLAGIKTATEQTSTNWEQFGSVVSNTARQGLTALSRWEIASLALENAQDRVLQAQENVTYAMQRYGAGSREAINAQRNLEIYSRSLEIAQQRLWIRMAFASLTVLPNLITNVKGLITHFGLLKTSTDIATASTHAFNAAQLAKIAIMTLGLAVPIALIASQMATQAYGQQQQAANVNVYGPQYFGAPQGIEQFQQMQTQMSQARVNR